MIQPLVSAIISTYNSEEFIKGRLDNLIEQTIFDEIEIIIVNSGSKQNEESIINEYLSKHKNIKYLKTEERETIYKAWNRGIQIARGKFITNANTDDRLKQDALEILTSYLERNPDVAMVYADQIISHQPNEKFNQLKNYKTRKWNDFSVTRLLEASLTGPQPMWRASLHFEDNIWFNEKLEIAGDYDFACRIALRYDLFHLSKTLGVYYLSDKNENKEYSDKDRTREESLYVRNKYSAEFIKQISSKEFEFYINYYSRWSESNIILFYLWKLVFRIFLPERRLETKEFVIFFAAKLNCYAGLNKKAIKICNSYLINNSSYNVQTIKNLLEKKPSYDIPISVIIPTFDRPNFLKNSLDSLINQSYKNFEVIVINNGILKISEIIKQYSEKLNIKLFDSDVKRNVSYAKNIGLKNASGKYIAYLDDDDWYHPKHLEILFSHLEKSESLFVYSDAEVELQDKIQETYVTVKKFIEYSKDFDKNLLLIKDYIFTPCVMHHRRCFEIVGFFDEQLMTDEDMDMWIRMSRIYKFEHIKKVTCSVRRTSDSRSLTKDWKTMYQNAKYLNQKHFQYGKFNPRVRVGRMYYLALRKIRAIKSQNGPINNYY